MDKNSQVLLDTLKTHKILLNRTPLAVNPFVKREYYFNNYIFYYNVKI